ncbi:MAG: ribonuclease P protein component [Acidobacteriota bacterium]|nr:ribonuclease P protein component [Acidobacteriota bacterium]MDQ7087474.1 ribonuclease P protein component [Acidobacteriota bacterium]
MNAAACRTFPASVRLKKRREYLEVYDRGVRVAGSHIVLFVLPTERGGPRLGVTATRRVGAAVRRNRARRVIREVFRHHRHRLPAWDLVVNVRRSAPFRSYRRLEQDFLNLVGRAEKRLSYVRTGESP